MTASSLRQGRRRLPRRLLWLPLLVGCLISGLSELRAEEGPESSQTIHYSRDIQPILSKNCFACHGADEAARKANLRLDLREVATSELEDGSRAIVPGDPDSSELLFRISEPDESIRMPPAKAGPMLSKAEVERLQRWIAQGAPYDEHWAFVPPQDHPLPEVSDPSWVRDGIDAWILARLDREGLKPSPEADRHQLLRRASLDLRGLPPTPEEIQAFVSDESPDAYEKAVQRFLDDPAFGERWARVWLDLARYADSAGLGSDPLRPNMWRYRDWVINAFNRNMPYDRFTIEQIAGDLLPEPTLDQRVATAFNRNTMTNTEGGTDDEEFRIAAVKDRVDTTVQVWMGLTMGCAKCHTHKYDPISHEEYYQFFAIFNQTADHDQPDERPTIPAPSHEQAAAIARIDAQIADLGAKLDADTPELAAAQAAWEAELSHQPDWRPITPVAMEASSGASLEAQPDGSIRVRGEGSPVRESYTIQAETPAVGLVAFRLETIPDATLPAGGAGRAADGNFVLSHFAIEAEPLDTAKARPTGKVVRIEIPGKGKILALAEVQVFLEGENLAARGQARQSSTAHDGEARLAIDGRTDGDFFQARSTTHTATEANPWWEVELPKATPIDRIVVWNRTDGNVGGRLANFRVSVLDEDRRVVWRSDVAEPPGPSLELTTAGKRAVALNRASADFSQSGFAVSDTIQQETPEKGWAVGPRIQEPHAAVFLTEKPLETKGPVRLTFHLEHAYRDPGFALGRFRLSATRDPVALKRADVPAEVLAAIAVPEAERSDADREAIARHYRSIAPGLQPIRDGIAKLEASKPKPPMLPVMVELPPEQHRETHILLKGNYLDPGAKVEPGLLAKFHPLPEGSQLDRLGVARWLVDPANPLTARVAVNRYWARLLGAGLVETEEDFGTQGEPPSHPELLDWLAIRFMDSGWDTKALLKEIVLSATYRQTSRVTPELLEKDPRNRLLARAPRYRMEAEMIRDQALALSGLLNRRVGGPSVFPPQPEGLWQAAFNGQRTWKTSAGEDQHRRGLYTFWRRTVPYPSMATFDAPSRELCTLRRSRTNTPLQALVTMNDPVYLEASQALGRRLVREGGKTLEDRLRYGLLLCLGRPGTDREVAVLAELYHDAKARYQQDAEAARALATEPIGPLPEGAEPAEMAAWTALGNVLLNLDGVLTKG